MSSVTRPTLSSCAHLLFIIIFTQASYGRRNQWQDLNHNRPMMRNSICILLNVACEEDVKRGETNFLTNINHHEFKSGNYDKHTLRHFNSNFTRNPESRNIPPPVDFNNVPYVLKRRRRRGLKTADDSISQETTRDRQLINKNNIFNEENVNNEHLSGKRTTQPNILLQMMLKINTRIPTLETIEISNFTQSILIQSASTNVLLPLTYPEPVFQKPKDASSSTREHKETDYSDGFIMSKVVFNNIKHAIGSDKPKELLPIPIKPSVFYSSDTHLSVSIPNTQYQLNVQYIAENRSTLTPIINLSNHSNLVFFSDEQSTKHLEKGAQINLSTNHFSNMDYKNNMLKTSESGTELYSSEVTKSSTFFHSNIAYNDPNTFPTNTLETHLEPLETVTVNNVFTNNYRNSKNISPSSVLPDSFEPVYDFVHRAKNDRGVKYSSSFFINLNSERHLNEAKRTGLSDSKQKNERFSNFDSRNEEYIKSSLNMKFEEEFLNPNTDFKFPERTPSLPWHKLKVTRSVLEASFNSDSIGIDSSFQKLDKFLTDFIFHIQNTKWFPRTILETGTISVSTSKTATVESVPNILKRGEALTPSSYDYATDKLNTHLLQFSTEKSRYEKRLSEEGQNRTTIATLSKNSENSYPYSVILNPQFISFVISSTPPKADDFHATPEYENILAGTETSLQPRKSPSFKDESINLKIKPNAGNEFLKGSYSTKFIDITKPTTLFKPVYKTILITNNEELGLKNSLFKTFEHNIKDTVRLSVTLDEDTVTNLADDYIIALNEADVQSLKSTHWSSKTSFIDTFYKNFVIQYSDNSSTQMPGLLESSAFLEHNIQTMNVFATPAFYWETESISSDNSEISLTKSGNFDAIPKNFPSTLQATKTTVILQSVYLSNYPLNLFRKKYELNNNGSRTVKIAESFKTVNSPLDLHIYQSSKLMLTVAREEEIVDFSTSSTSYAKLTDEMVTATKYNQSKRTESSNLDIINSTNKYISPIENNTAENTNDALGFNGENLRNQNFTFMENDLTENPDGNTGDNGLFDSLNVTAKNLIRTERDLSENTESAADEISGQGKIQSSSQKFFLSDLSLVENNESAVDNGTLHETSYNIFHLDQNTLKTGEAAASKNSFVDLTTEKSKRAVDSPDFISDISETTNDFGPSFLSFSSKRFISTEGDQLENSENTEKNVLQTDASSLTDKHGAHFVGTNFPKSRKSDNDDNTAVESLIYSAESMSRTDSRMSGTTASTINDILLDNITNPIRFAAENSEDSAAWNDESITDDNFLFKSFDFTSKNLVLTEINSTEETELSTGGIYRILETNDSNENTTNHHKFSKKDESIIDSGFEWDLRNKSRNYTEHNILEDFDKREESTTIFNETTFFDKTVMHSEEELSSHNVTDADMTFDPFRFSDERLVRTERDLFNNPGIIGNPSSQSNITNFADKGITIEKTKISTKEESTIDADLVSSVIKLENKTHVATESSVLGNNIDEASGTTSRVNEASFTYKNIMPSTEDSLRNNYSGTDAVVKLDPISFVNESRMRPKFDASKRTEIPSNVSLNFSYKNPVFSQSDFFENVSLTNTSLVDKTFTPTLNTIISINSDITKNNNVITNDISEVNVISLTDKTTMGSREVSLENEDTITAGNVKFDPIAFTEDIITEGSVLLDPSIYTDKSVIRTERDLLENTENTPDLNFTINFPHLADTTTNPPESIQTQYDSLEDNKEFYANNLKKNFLTERNLFQNTESSDRSGEVSTEIEDKITEGNVLLDRSSYTDKSVIRTERDLLENTENTRDLNFATNFPHLADTITDTPQNIQTQYDSLDNEEFYANNFKKSFLTEHNVFQNTESSDRSGEVSTENEDKITEGNVLLDRSNYTDKSVIRTERDLLENTENTRDLNFATNFPHLADTITDTPQDIQTQYDSLDDNEEFYANNLKKSFLTERNLFQNTESSDRSGEVSAENEDNITVGNVLLDPSSYTDTSVVRTERDLFGTTESVQTQHDSLDNDGKFQANNLKKSFLTLRDLFETTEPSAKSGEVFFGSSDNITEGNDLLNPVSYTYKSVVRTERDVFENTENTRELNSEINLPYLPGTITNAPVGVQTQYDSFDDKDELHANNSRKSVLTERNSIENMESSAKSIDDSSENEEIITNDNVLLEPLNHSDKSFVRTERDLLGDNESTPDLDSELYLPYLPSTIRDPPESTQTQYDSFDNNDKFHRNNLKDDFLTESNLLENTEPSASKSDFDFPDTQFSPFEREKFKSTESSDLNTVRFSDGSMRPTEREDSRITENSDMDITNLRNENVVTTVSDKSESDESLDLDALDLFKTHVIPTEQQTENKKKVNWNVFDLSVNNISFPDREWLESTENLDLFSTIAHQTSEKYESSGIDALDLTNKSIVSTERDMIKTTESFEFGEVDLLDKNMSTDNDILKNAESSSVVNSDVNGLVNISSTELNLFRTLSNSDIFTDGINENSTSSDTTSSADKEIIRTEREIFFPVEDISDSLLPNGAEGSSLGMNQDDATSSEILPIEPFEQSYDPFTDKGTLIPKTTNFELNNRPSTEFGIGPESSESLNVHGKKDIPSESSRNQPPNGLKTENPGNRIPYYTVETESEHPLSVDDVTVDNTVLKRVLKTEDSNDELDFTESESCDQTTLFGENGENTNIELNNNESSITAQTNYDSSTEKSNKSKRDKPGDVYLNGKERNATVRKTANDFIPKEEIFSDGHESISIATAEVSIDQSTTENDADYGLDIVSRSTTVQHSPDADQFDGDVYQEENHQMSSKPLHSQADVNPVEQKSLFNAQNRPIDSNSFTHSTDPESLAEDQYNQSNQESRDVGKEDENDYDESDASEEQSTASLEKSTDEIREDFSEGTSTDESVKAGINSNSAENGISTEANRKPDVSTATTTESSILSFHFTIDADYDEIVGSNKTEFEASLSKQLGVAMRVPLECVQNLRVSKGSIEVNFDLVPNADYGHLADESALKKAADELKRMIDTGQLTINDLKGNTMVVIPIDPPTQPPSASEVEHTSLILGVVIGAFILTVIMVAITAIIVKRKNSGDQRLTPIEEARSKLPSYREIPFQEALFVKDGPNKLMFGKYNYDTGQWLGPGPEPRPFEPPNSVVYRPPTDSEIRQTPRPTTAVRERLKNDWELDWDSLVSSR